MFSMFRKLLINITLTVESDKKPLLPFLYIKCRNRHFNTAPFFFHHMSAPINGYPKADFLSWSRVFLFRYFVLKYEIIMYLTKEYNSRGTLFSQKNKIFRVLEEPTNINIFLIIYFNDGGLPTPFKHNHSQLYQFLITAILFLMYSSYVILIMA